MDRKKKIDARDILPQFAAMNDQERAAQLVHALFHGDMSPELRRQFLEWFHSDLNKEAKEKAIQEYINRLEPDMDPDMEEVEALERLSELTGMDGGTARAIREKVARRERKMKLRRWTMRAAAVVIPAIAIGGFWMLGSRGTNEATTSETTVAAADREQTITLPDGSTVRLTAGGELNYARDFAADRTVELHGEGYFTVVEAQGKPFTVKSETMTVTVLGTEFRMRSIDGEQTAEVTLAAGKVEVTAGDQTRTLSPGQRITYDKQRNTIETDELGRGGMLRLRGQGLSFAGEPLGDAIRLIGQYYGYEVVTAPGMKEHTSTITVDFEYSDKIENVLFLIRAINMTFDYRIEEDKIVITPSSK